ncbi:hypothetical protein N8878_03625 [Psychromonas sp.]|nr:hypothetical protein [Psychromonas sp.]
MRLFITFLILCNISYLYAAECDAPDVSNYEYFNGNFSLGTAETYTVPSGKDGLYVNGYVTLNNRSKLIGYLYATGSVELKNSATVTEDVFSESTITLKNNADIGGVSCENVESSFIDLPVDELIGQCTDIFKDAAQSYNTSSLLTMYNTAVISDDTNSFDFESYFLYGNPDSCGTGVMCTSTGEQSTALSGFTIPIISGDNISATPWQDGDDIYIGGADDVTNGEFAGTVFGTITIQQASVTFLEQADPLNTQYQINSINFVNSSATLNLYPGVYALRAFSAQDGGTINIIGDGDVYLFIQSPPSGMKLTVNGDPTKFHLVLNSGMQLYNSTVINGSVYVNGNLVMDDNSQLNGKVASQNLTMSGTAKIINQEICGVIPLPDVYTFTFDGTQSQALTCEAHAVAIQVRLNDVIDESYVKTINLSTSTGVGDWNIEDTDNAKGTLDNGTAGDGIATYQFVDSDDGQVELYLTHTLAGAVTITTTNNDATETVDLVFSSAVLKTELSCVNHSLGTCVNTANLPFNLTLTAVKEDEQTLECVNYDPTGIIFWSEYITPSSPEGLAVEIDGNEISKNYSTATETALTFNEGVATVSVNYPDAGQIQIHAQDVSSTEIQGEAETIVNPLQLLVESIIGSNGNNNPETTDSGDGFIRASIVDDYQDPLVDTFNVTVTAIKDCSNDTKSHCSGTYGKRTPSFANKIDLTTSLIFPSTGSLGNLHYQEDDDYLEYLDSGEFTYENLAYDEVGTLGLTAKTGEDYLIAGNSIESLTTQSIGRFYPDYLAFGSFSATPACNDDFTYLGQTEIEVSYNMKAYAQRASNILPTTTLQNYDYTLGYPVAGSQLLADQSDSFSDQIYDQSPLSLTDRLLPDSYYFPSSWVAGQFNVIALDMGVAKTTSPDGPYFVDDNKIDYFIKLSGFDGEKIQTDSISTCSDDSCYLGSLGNLVYGRLQAGNGHGSEYQAVRTNITSTYYDGTLFSDFTRDICTPVTISQVSSVPSKADTTNQIIVTDPVTGSTGVTILSIENSPLIDGKSLFNFSAPDSRGDLDYYIDLNTDSVAPWLLDSGNAVACPEDSSGLEDCIAGHVEFGLFRGNDRIIYRLETFN